MTKNKKILLGLGAGVLIYWVWSRNKAGKSLNPFAKSSSFAGGDDFFNASGRTSRRAGTRVFGNPPDNTIYDCPKCSDAGKCYVITPRTAVTIDAGIAGMKAEQSCNPPSKSDV